MDFSYLENLTGNDDAVVRDILRIFLEQAAEWRAKLSAPDKGWRDVIHTIKGASRGIGANALGDVCERAEHGDPAGIADVLGSLDAVVGEVRAYLGG